MLPLFFFLLSRNVAVTQKVSYCLVLFGIICMCTVQHRSSWLNVGLVLKMNWTEQCRYGYCNFQLLRIYLLVCSVHFIQESLVTKNVIIKENRIQGYPQNFYFSYSYRSSSSLYILYIYSFEDYFQSLDLHWRVSGHH